MKRTLAYTCIISCISILPAYGADLLQVYQQASSNNATYQSAKATYEAAKYNVPISRAGLLPSLSLTANTTYNRVSPGSNSYNTNGYTLSLTQPVFNFSAWKTYTQAEFQLKQAAITFAKAQQTLIMTIAQDYFNILNTEDQLQYAEKNEDSLKQQMEQTNQQYKVGLKAYTDVEATRASYESAIASTISARNAYHNAIEQLAADSGKTYVTISSLKPSIPLIQPAPNNPNDWVNFGLNNNLTLQYDALQAEIQKLGISIAKAGYYPTINATGSYEDANSNEGSHTTTNTTTAGLSLSMPLYSGGATKATVAQNQYEYQSDVATVAQDKLNTQSSVKQSYLNIGSDIGQVKALQQAIISAQSSLTAIRAAYLVGTRTIVDVLTAQSTLYSEQQQYAQAVYTYITDTLTLKQNAGTLSENDIAAINNWLKPE